MWGIHVTKLRGARSLLLFLAPHQVGFFLEYLDLYLMEFVQINLFLVVAILQYGLILENIWRVFFVQIHVHCSGSPD